MTGGATRDPELVVVADASAAAQEAADRLVRLLADATAARGVAHWATTGGSTAPALYGALGRSTLRGTVRWGDVHVWFGDDRYVPYDHPQSNALPLDQVVPDPLPIPTANIHRIPTTEAIAEGRDPAWAAARYAIELREYGPAATGSSDGIPPGIGALDVIVLGIGPDGHLLSVFPDSPVWDVGASVVTVPAPTHVEPHVARLTLHPAFITAARHVLVVATGGSKADALERAWTAGTDPRATPARVAVRPGATWIVDEAAAARIPGRS